MHPKHRPIGRIFLLLTLFAGLIPNASSGPVPAAAGDPGTFRPVREFAGVREYVLPQNGLRVLLAPNPFSPLITVATVYDAGSVRESTGQTGAAHFLEHMVFTRTANFDWKKGRGILALLDRIGAEHNAATGLDATYYFAHATKDKLEWILDVEADRMRHALLQAGDFEKEKSVVLNEALYHENSPLTRFVKTLWKTAYETHPYRNLTIGETGEIRALTLEKLRQFYNEHYWPSRATLILTGDFDIPAVLELITARFGAIGRGPDMPAAPPEEPDQTKPRREVLASREAMNLVALGHKIPGAGHPDYLKLQILGHVLTSGKSSRLYRALVDKGLAAAAESFAYLTREPGLFVTYAVLTPGTGHKKVRKVILKAYERLIEEGVAQEELELIKQRARAESFYAKDGSRALAEMLWQGVAIGDWTLPFKTEERLQAITVEDLRQTAAAYLNDQTMTLVEMKGSSKQAVSTGSLDMNPNAHQNPSLPSDAPVQWKDRSFAVFAPQAPLGPSIQSTRMGPAFVLSLPSPVDEVVSLAGSIDGAGTAFAENSLIAEVTTLMLGLGTQHRDKFQLSRPLEENAVDMTFEVTPGRLRFHARGLHEDLDTIMQTLAEVLRESTFSEENFNEARRVLLTELQRRQTGTGDRALNALIGKIYPPDHANYQAPFEEQIKMLADMKLSAVRDFYAQAYGANRFTLVAAGAVDHDEIEALVEKYFSGWAPNTALKNPVFEAGQPEAGRTLIDMPQKHNIDVVLGQPLALTRPSPDYLPLFMGLYALGGDMSAVLLHELRTLRGWSYAAFARTEGIDDRTQGHWYIRIIGSAANAPRSLTLALQLLQDFLEKGIDPADLQNRKGSLAGHFFAQLSSTGAIADAVLRSEEMGLGYRYLDEYPKEINALTAEQVNHALRKYLDPQKLQIIMAGDLGGAEDVA